MRDSGKNDVINLNELAVAFLKLIGVGILLLLCVRFCPFVWGKLILAVLVLIFGLRWVFRSVGKGKKPASRRQAPPRAQVNRATPKAQSPASRQRSASVVAADDDEDVIQRLIAFDAKGEFGKAKTLIQSLDGKKFSQAEAERLEVLAKNYFPVAIEPTGEDYLFKLV